MGFRLNPNFLLLGCSNLRLILLKKSAVIFEIQRWQNFSLVLLLYCSLNGPVGFDSFDLVFCQ